MDINKLSETVKDFIKIRLTRGTTFYQIASGLYHRLKPDVQAQCYRQYRRSKLVHLVINGMSCHYEAVSPKNFWHLTIQNGERHPEFGTQLLPGDIVFDVGAHVGAWTMPYAKYVGPTGRVFAMEPELTGHNAVIRNAALNSLDNVSVLHVAISDFNGTASFYTRPDKDTHSLFEATTAPSPLGVQHEYQIDVRTLDELVAEGAVLRPDFVKIDVEGAELKVLEGMRQILPLVRAVLIECHEVLRAPTGRAPNDVVIE
jgi:FkbM family methyltransferase